MSTDIDDHVLFVLDLHSNIPDGSGSLVYLYCVVSYCLIAASCSKSVNCVFEYLYIHVDDSKHPWPHWFCLENTGFQTARSWVPSNTGTMDGPATIIWGARPCLQLALGEILLPKVNNELFLSSRGLRVVLITQSLCSYNSVWVYYVLHNEHTLTVINWNTVKLKCYPSNMGKVKLTTFPVSKIILLCNIMF